METEKRESQTVNVAITQIQETSPTSSCLQEPQQHSGASNSELVSGQGIVQPHQPSPSQSQPKIVGKSETHFPPGKIKEIIGVILKEKLSGAKYDVDAAPRRVGEITEAIKAQLKDMNMERYKLVVHAVLGEQRGQSFQMSCRCFWDPNTDNYAHESFTNDSIFCVAGAFTLYMS